MNNAPIPTTNKKDATKPSKEQTRPTNPYTALSTKQNVSKPPATTPPHTRTNSPPTFPMYSPPYSDFKPSPYSPTNPSAAHTSISSVTPPKFPAQVIIPPSTIVTPTRSFNPHFMYPSSNNSTAGHTPFHPEIKRKLDFGPGKKIVRSVKKMKLLSHSMSQSQNKLFYQLLPDGIICVYAAKGTPNGPPGFLQPPLRSILEALKAGLETELVSDI